MNRKVTFDGAAPPGTINLGIGQPSEDLLPVELVRKASDAFFASAEPYDLNYGVPQGDARFRESLAAYLAREYGKPASPDSLIVSGGNSQALDFLSVVFAKPGDTVFVEEPSYFLAFQIFRDHGLNIVGIPLDAEGISIPHLERALRNHKPAFLYTIPSYQNPGGQCLPLERRNKLVDLATEHDFLVVADEVYQLLHYYDAPPPALGTMTDSDAVISLGSFSKILAPAMRLGWIQTSPKLRKSILANGYINSGGSINHISSHVARHAIDLGLLDDHVQDLRRAYRSRVEAMDEVLRSEFSSLAEWNMPEGGYFFWLEFATGTDTSLLRREARACEAGFQPGTVFSSGGGLANCMRLSFAHYAEDEITEGVRRIRSLFG
ncbi:MAG: PLP-dependent aminotransferase family protein [Woeseiaceae bacterium]